MSYFPRLRARKNSADPTYTEPRINFVEGDNISITLTDDPANEEVILEIAGEAGGGGADSVEHAFARKTADESVTSSTTSQDDDHLFFDVAANEIWTFEAYIAYSSAGAGDIRAQITGPAGSTVHYTILGTDASVAALDNAGFVRRVGGTDSGHGADSTIRPLWVRGVIVNGATAGQVRVRWAQLTSDATATIVRSGSWLSGHRRDGGSGGGSAWTTYDPAWTATSNPSIGNGTKQGAYRIDGKTLFLRINLIMGSSTTFGTGDWTFALPGGVVAKTGAQQTILAHARDAGTAFFLGAGRILSAATTFQISAHSGIRWNATVPFTWVSTDELEITGVIEID